MLMIILIIVIIEIIIWIMFKINLIKCIFGNNLNVFTMKKMTISFLCYISDLSYYLNFCL